MPSKIILSTAVVFSALFTFLQFAEAQDSTPIIRDHRSKATVRDHRPNVTVRDHRIKAIYLTKDECTQLGGETKETGLSICGSAEYCKRVGADGKIYRVCISKTDTATKNAPKSSTSRKPQRSGKLTPTTSSEVVVVAMPLTSQECEGLGGVVRNTSECGAQTQACVTTDQHGVIRTACINKAEK